MGLAASQCRLLVLTSRQSDIQGELMSISMRRLRLAAQSSDLSNEFANSLNATKLTWDTVGGKTDLTYNLLMTPNSVNNAGQYMIGDANGRVILDDDYANVVGGAGVNSGSAGACGITAQEFLQKMMNVSATDAAKYITSYSGSNSGSIADAIGGVSDLVEDITKITGSMDKISGNSASNAAGFPADSNCNISETCYQTMRAQFNALAQNLQNVQKSSSYNNYSDTEKKYVQQMLKNVQVAQQQLNVVYNSDSKVERMAGLAVIKSLMEGVPVKTTIEGEKHGTWFRKENEENKAADLASDIMKSLGSSYFKDAGSYFAGNMSELSGLASATGVDSDKDLSNQDVADFYLNLYRGINSQGWVRNSAIDQDDGSYMQNMLLNGSANLYRYTADGWRFVSDSDVTALNEESDEEAIEKSEADYERKKDLIDAEEKMLDLRQNNLDTELSAIQTEKESVQKIINENVKIFKMFDA